MDTTTHHLDADQLCAAMVAESRLPPEAARHLTGCPACRQALVDTQARLGRLAARARAAVPVPQRRLVLNEAAVGRRRRWSWRVASLAAAAMLLLAVSTVGIYPELLPGGAGDGSRGERLAAALDYLKQTILPSADMQLAGDGPLEVDEEFMDFLIPEGDPEPLSIVEQQPETVS